MGAARRPSPLPRRDPPGERAPIAPAMFLVQILLPLSTDGAALPRELFAEVGQELTDRFGGLTAYTRAPATGLWQSPGGTTTEDQVVVYEVMADRLDRAWWADYRRVLETRFQQQEVVIRAQPMERL